LFDRVVQSAKGVSDASVTRDDRPARLVGPDDEMIDVGNELSLSAGTLLESRVPSLRSGLVSDRGGNSKHLLAPGRHDSNGNVPLALGPVEPCFDETDVWE